MSPTNNILPRKSRCDPRVPMARPLLRAWISTSSDRKWRGTKHQQTLRPVVQHPAQDRPGTASESTYDGQHGERTQHKQPLCSSIAVHGPTRAAAHDTNPHKRAVQTQMACPPDRDRSCWISMCSRRGSWWGFAAPLPLRSPGLGRPQPPLTSRHSRDKLADSRQRCRIDNGTLPPRSHLAPRIWVARPIRDPLAASAR
jgi:hypothetical protein